MENKALNDVVRDNIRDFTFCVDKETFAEIIRKIYDESTEKPYDLLDSAKDTGRHSSILNSYIRIYYDDPSSFFETFVEAITDYEFSKDVYPMSFQDLFFGWCSYANDSMMVGHDIGLKIQSILHKYHYNDCSEEIKRIIDDYEVYLREEGKAHE